MKRQLATALVVALISPVVLGAVDGKKAQYIGGTVAAINEEAEGRFDVSGETAIVFRPEKQAPFEIPYVNITELEYGQKAGRRVGVAIMISPLALFSKKRKHYLTITFDDAAGKEQAAVFELGKDIVRTTLKIVETRSGKDIIYQDDEARKSMGGGRS